MVVVKEISAKGFRGIANELRIQLHGKSLLLLGDNGTGKSSVVEAVEHALTGTVKSLTNKGRRVSPNKHCTHVNHPAGQHVAGITVTHLGKEIFIQQGKSAASDAHVDSFITAASDGTFILRRETLLKFLISEDKERYEACRPFLGLDKFEAMEKAAKEAEKQLDADVTVLKAQVQTKQRSLQAVAGLAPDSSPFSTALLNLLSQELQQHGFPAVESIDELNKVTEAASSQLKSANSANLTAARFNAIESVANLPTLEDLQALTSARSKLKEAKGTFYEKVLTDGQRWISEASLVYCPLCEQSIDRQVLIAKIQERLEENREVVATRAAFSAAASATETKLKEVLRKGSASKEAWTAIGRDASQFPLNVAMDWAEKTLCAIKQSDGDGYDLLVPQVPNAVALRITVESQFVDVDQISSKLSLIEKCKVCSATLQELAALTESLSSKSAQLAELSEIASIATASRKKSCEYVFTDIEATIETIYNRFHPDEPLGCITLDVKERGQGSITVSGKFAHKTDEDPRAYYSEAHQDTLGLAIYLALRKHADSCHASFNLLVLDDILTSVDANHRQRVAEYLLDEVAAGKQLIITTHSRPWYEWFMHLQTNRGLTGKFINQRILDWTLEDGPRVENFQSDVEYLKTAPSDIPKDRLVPLAGRLLEDILREMRYNFELSISAKRDEKYTLGDIWPKFITTTEKEYKQLWKKIQPVCDRLKNTWGMRNWQTHANDWAKELSGPECQSFIDPVLELFDQLFCKQCGSFVRTAKGPQGLCFCKKGCIIFMPNTAANATSNLVNLNKTS